MVIKLEQNQTQNDIEVIIKYPQKNKAVERIVSLIESTGIQIPCYSDDGTEFVSASGIYYIESVDKKTIVCGEKKNYQVKDPLYKNYKRLANTGFVQINKYCILNVNKLEKIRPLGSSHLEAVLTNGKCLYVTRKYLADIKRLLQEEE